MKVLKIENKRCYFSIDGNSFNSIVDITKEDIYSILDIIFESEDFIIDELNEDVVIANEVERLIYENIVSQLNVFIDNKESLQNEIKEEFKEVTKKYELVSG